MESRDLEQVILVARLSARPAATPPRCSTRWRKRARERGELRRLIQTLTAQGRMSRWIITALPIALLVFVSVLNPGYTHRCSRPAADGWPLVIGAVLLPWDRWRSSGS